MALDLICLGNLTIDDIVQPDGVTRMGCFGGDAIYAALAASYWTDSVQFVAPLGSDFPSEHLSHLERAHWDVSGLPRRLVPSIRNWVVYEYDGRRTWILRSNPADFLELSPTWQDIPLAFREAKAAMILAMDLAAQETLASSLKASGALVALDPQEDYIAGNEERILKMLSRVDIFLPSQEEVYRLLGHRDYARAAREFASFGCRIVVVKLGGEGSLIFDQTTGKCIELPVYPAKVVDTTGAGDAYCGGFLAMYVQSHDLVKAGLAGAVSASFAIEEFGLAHMFQVDRSTAQQRLRDLAALYSKKK